MEECTHLDQLRDVKPRTSGCEECLQMGGSWVHLRMCAECGHVGCCDSSKNKHATRHFHVTGHPIIRSYEPGETWGWCYVDEVGLEFGEALKPVLGPSVGPGSEPAQGNEDHPAL